MKSYEEVFKRCPLPLFIFNIHMKYLHVTCDVSVRYIPVAWLHCVTEP